MANKERKSPVEVFIQNAESDGYELDAIPLKAAKVGDFYGKPTDGTEIDEADEKPVAITAGNLSSLGNREVIADGMTITLSIMGREREVQIETLRFSKGSSHWPAAIRDQVPEIAEMFELRRRIREVQQNPRLKKQFVAWLTDNPDSRALLDAMSADMG